ncbi:UNVERIFIED_CONTAM: hypothetical protein Slati_1339400 [Sesamum latifolium]|uniref:CCHC-type domain-containing protein n=1 Tax=Sesamum latifolium TaxID=2727402 RepID=A0AAW2XHY9_9LAMI
MLNEITSFVQLDMESLCDAWECFKVMLRTCPHHELPAWRQVETFYNGVTLANRATIDATASGTIMKKLPSKAFNIIDKIAINLYSCGQERTDKRVAGVHSIDAITALSAQMAVLTQKMDNLGVAMRSGAPIGPCNICGQMGHFSQDCQIMPSYAKFLKEVISNKRKWEGGKMMKLNEKCSVHRSTTAAAPLQVSTTALQLGLVRSSVDCSVPPPARHRRCSIATPSAAVPRCPVPFSLHLFHFSHCHCIRSPPPPLSTAPLKLSLAAALSVSVLFSIGRPRLFRRSALLEFLCCASASANPKEVFYSLIFIIVTGYKTLRAMSFLSVGGIQGFHDMIDRHNLVVWMINSWAAKMNLVPLHLSFDSCDMIDECTVKIARDNGHE